MINATEMINLINEEKKKHRPKIDEHLDKMINEIKVWFIDRLETKPCPIYVDGIELFIVNECMKELKNNNYIVSSIMRPNMNAYFQVSLV